ncbi:5226_t:CDS:1, partial [Acaulospora morrowiae]
MVDAIGFLRFHYTKDDQREDKNVKSLYRLSGGLELNGCIMT